MDLSRAMYAGRHVLDHEIVGMHGELVGKVDSLKRVRFFKSEEDLQTYAKEVDNIVLPPSQIEPPPAGTVAEKPQKSRVRSPVGVSYLNRS